MAELNEIEILKARIEIQKARIEELENENRHYLEVIKRKSEEGKEKLKDEV